MLDDDPQTGDASEEKSAVPTSDVPELALDDAKPPALANPVALIQGFRFLQQRIPEFTQLSAEEERALIRVATLDPEFIEAGIRTGSAWSETKTLIGYSGEELRREVDESLRWEEAELRALLKGLSAANRKRRHRIGRSILTLYMILGRTIDNVESRRYLRPHYEEMKRAYLNRKRKRRKNDRVG